MTTLFDADLALRPAWAALPWLIVIVGVAVVARRRLGPPLARAGHWAVWLARAAVLALVVAVVLNPVRVATDRGSISRPEVHILLDASESMRLGTPDSRWQEATAFARSVLAQHNGRAEVRVHRFGERLVGVDAATGDFGQPDDADSRLGAALKQLSARLGREAPAGVVVVSDGRVRDADQLDATAQVWNRLRVPVHVVPVGRAAGGGDAAIVGAIAPSKARKHSQVTATVFVRSFGFDGRRTELQLQALDDAGRARRVIASVPVTLRDGVQPLTVSFRTDADAKKMRLHLPPLPGDLAPANNDFPIDLDLDRTKIRVLLLDGSPSPGGLRPQAVAPGEGDADTPYAPFRDALLADPDIQCVVYQVSAGGRVQRVLTPETSYLGSNLPQSTAELLAYDALVLSNVPRAALTDDALGWIDEWIGRRGGGLLMAGGPASFGAGGWAGTAVERILPVEFAGSPDWDAAPIALEPAGAGLHPAWRLFEDERATRAALRRLPEVGGHNAWVRVKPQSGTLVGAQKTTGAPLLAVGAYGRGRAMALSTPLSATWAPQFARQWGEEGDNRHYAKFARNLVYWLTEDSGVGRRRLVADTDKRFYRPGETITVSAQTFDEAANRTARYRVVAMLEPRQLGGSALPPSPVKWPAGRPRAPGESGPLAGWGEEIALSLDAASKDHALALPLSESVPGGAGCAFKLELTAYEGSTQIDSSSIDVQVLGDPFESQNPLPNRESLMALAKATGGREFADPADLAALLNGLPAGEATSTVRYTPLWSRGWLLGALLGVLGAEWLLRRWLGLA